DDYSPVISPDGKTVAFVSRRADAAGDIHLLPISASLSSILGKGDNADERIKLERSEVSNADWYPNSKRVVSSSRKVRQRLARIYTSSTSDYQAKPLSDLVGEQPTVSHDGALVAYVRGRGIFSFAEDRGKESPLTSGSIYQDGKPHFSNDGQFLYFVRYVDDTNNDNIINPDDHP